MNNNDSRGFTILELVVAMALMLLIVTVLMQAFFNASEAVRRSQAYIETYQTSRVVFDFMERDIEGAILSKYEENGNIKIGYFEITESSYKDAADNDHDKHALRLLTKTMNPGYARIAEVGYFLQEYTDTDGKASDVRLNRLVRAIDYVSDDDPGTGDASDLILSTKVRDRYKSIDVLATGITDIEIAATGGSSTGMGGGWIAFTRLPASVKVTLYVTDGKGLFLFQDTEQKKRNWPFCGYGVKFEHTVLVNQDNP